MKREQYKLVVLGGPMDGEEFVVDKPELTIGRLEDQDVCLPLDPAVSRRHARLQVKEDGYWLEDIGSTNGIFIGSSEEKITTVTSITPETFFRLGSYTTLKFIMENIEEKLIHQAGRLMTRLARNMPQVAKEKWQSLKDKIINFWRSLDKIKSNDELFTLLHDLVIAIEEAFGKKIIPDSQQIKREGCPGSSPIPSDQPPAGDELETLKSFFKSNLDEIIKKMEAQESGESKE